jgi:hypothetical protein
MAYLPYNMYEGRENMSFSNNYLSDSVAAFNPHFKAKHTKSLARLDDRFPGALTWVKSGLATVKPQCSVIRRPV